MYCRVCMRFPGVGQPVPGTDILIDHHTQKAEKDDLLPLFFKNVHL
ncbi:hypothetical protein J2Z70_003015 [Paenibacillus silagei]|uniref:Uncharacterized protein n=1 Tax=Paenibacillus silagei TaxID=1670801 RepID=A0ABS4NS27_9BACL|nr:hypothetical protein [Paenibacillus silagei]